MLSLPMAKYMFSPSLGLLILILSVVKLGFSMWGGSDPEGPPLPIRRVRRAKIKVAKKNP